MPYCIKCGCSNKSNAKFCFKCGEPLDATNNTQSRKISYSGEIIKCPNCGAVIENAIAVTCVSCGYEFRNVKLSNAMIEFKNGLERIDNRNNTFFINKIINAKTNSITQSKADYIKEFPIPNTKSDIIEFASLAYSNISLTNSDENDTLHKAWAVMFTNACQKAKIVFKDDPDYQKIEAMNNSLLMSKRNKYFMICIPIAVFVVICVFFFGGSYIGHLHTESELKEIQTEAQAALDSGDLDLAESKANSLIYDSNWSSKAEEKWEKQRKNLLLKISRKRISADSDINNEKFIIEVPFSSKELKGENYKDAQKRLEQAGFIFIETEEIADIKIGLLASENEVEKISINGKTDFDKGEEFPDDAEIVITYHTKEE